jgi:CheY-like chemotaxis protein
MLKKILLVEDSTLDAEFTLRALRDLDLPNAVLHAIDGEEALSILRHSILTANGAKSVGLVLLDLKLPKADGFDVLKAMKSTPALAEIPVVVVSSSFLQEDQTRAAFLGAASFIVKPWESEEFANLLHAAVKPFIGSLSRFVDS